MATSDYWGNRVAGKVAQRLLSQEDAIKFRLGQPRTRRQNTSDLLRVAVADPTEVSAEDRQALEGYLYDRYGEAARYVTPYIQSQTPEQNVNLPTEENLNAGSI